MSGLARAVAARAALASSVVRSVCSPSCVGHVDRPASRTSPRRSPERAAAARPIDHRERNELCPDLLQFAVERASVPFDASVLRAACWRHHRLGDVALVPPDAVDATVALSSPGTSFVSSRFHLLAVTGSTGSQLSLVSSLGPKSDGCAPPSSLPRCLLRNRRRRHTRRAHRHLRSHFHVHSRPSISAHLPGGVLQRRPPIPSLGAATPVRQRSPRRGLGLAAALSLSSPTLLGSIRSWMSPELPFRGSTTYRQRLTGG